MITDLLFMSFVSDQRISGIMPEEVAIISSVSDGSHRRIVH